LHLRMCTAEATPLEKIQGLLLKAEALLALGKDGVGQAIEEATKLAAHLQLPPDTIPDFDLVRARCLIAEGRHADAYRSLWRAETVARRLKSPFFETEVLALKSQLTKEEGDLQSAQALLTQALEVCRRHDYPLLEARLTKQVRALRDSLPAGFRFVVSRDQAEVQLLDDRVVRNSFKTYQLSGKLLQEFLRRPNVDIPVDELHERIWGTPIRNESHLTKIKTSVSRLRAQLKESEAPVDLVSQEYGSYRIVCRIPVQEEA
ncbi:MAG: helix-turn-helix domain-containing protein, partial [Bdellovibrionota bacterium]